MKNGCWSLLFDEHHFLFCSWRRKLQEAGVIDRKLLVIVWQRLWLSMKSIWFQVGLLWSSVLDWLWRTVFRSGLGMAWRLCLEGMPCNADLKYLKYRRSVLFPNFVVSVFVGFVLYLCHDLSWWITGSKFWYFCNNCSVIFSVGGRKIFSTSIFDKGIVSSGSWRSKT